jgi:hypothetical protein
MQPPRLEELSERLLRAGVARRVVARYLSELREHYEDALREELAGGADPAAAARNAWARIGETEQLVRSALARPELRSTAARFPGAVFGAGPALGWFTTQAMAIAAIALLVTPLLGPGIVPGWQRAAAQALCFAVARAVPAVLIAVVLASAARQRIDSRWPLAGAGLLALLAGTSRLEFVFTDALGEDNLFTGWSALPTLLAPFTDVFGPLESVELLLGLLRAALLLGVGAVGARAMLRYPRSERPAGAA